MALLRSDLSGLATGVGSLPFVDPQAALDLIFQCCPEIPFWPQLAKRSHLESMIAQFSENLPCLEATEEGVIYNSANREDKLEKFYERIISQDTDYFKISEKFGLGLYKFCQRLEKADLSKIKYIKCQVTGPFTFSAGLSDENGLALLHDDVFMQVITKGLIMKALWQIKLLRQFAKPLIVFWDEPYLGCFGSAYTPMTRERVVQVLKEASAAVQSEDVLVGAHCCGNTDWSMLTDIPGIDLINFDAFDYLERLVLYADNLKDFLGRGGILCWGIVPTVEFNSRITPEFLLEKVAKGIATLEQKGISRQIIESNLLFSPSCGLGTLDIGKAEGILKALAEVSRIFKLDKSR